MPTYQAKSLPKISSVQSVGPGGSLAITTSKSDPLNDIIAQGQANLQKRLDGFISTAFKVGAAEAKTEGATEGARNAQALLAQAKSTGQPITLDQLPGDPGSISIAKQAARKGALAVISSNFAVEGRRAITALALAAVLDPDITPQQFGQQLQDIVEANVSALAAISPAEAAKLGASLSLIANSTGVSQARTFATLQKNKRKAEAIASTPTYNDAIRTHIDNFMPREGYPTLKETIDAEVTQYENHLRNNFVAADTIANKVKTMRKNLVQHRIASIKRYAAEQGTDPVGGMFRVLSLLEKGENISKDNPHINSLVKSLKLVDRDKLVKTLRDEHSGLIGQRKAREENFVLGRGLASVNLQQDFYIALAQKDREKAQKIITQLKRFDRPTAEALEMVYNQGPISEVPNNPIVRRIEDKMGDPRKKVGEIYKEINEAEISQTEKSELSKKLAIFQDNKVKKALAIALADIEIDPALIVTMGKAATPEQRRLLSVYKKLKGKLYRDALNPAFDPLDFVDRELPKLIKDDAAKLVKKNMRQIIRRLPSEQEAPGFGAGTFDLRTVEGLLAAQAQIKKFRRDPKQNGARLDAASALITESIEAMSELAQ
jgi:hypothetical protein